MDVRRRLQCTRAAAVALAAWLGFGEFLIGHGAGARATGNYDAIVVAGCRVRPDGRPGVALARRAERAAALFRARLAPKIFTTGGRGASGHVESEAAARHLVRLGVPARAIAMERRSHSTEENALHAARALGRRARVLVVTDDYHVYRAERVFEAHFDHADAIGAGGPRGAIAYPVLREVLAVLIYEAAFPMGMDTTVAPPSRRQRARMGAASGRGCDVVRASRIPPRYGRTRRESLAPRTCAGKGRARAVRLARAVATPNARPRSGRAKHRVRSAGTTLSPSDKT